MNCQFANRITNIFLCIDNENLTRSELEKQVENVLKIFEDDIKTSTKNKYKILSKQALENSFKQ